MAYPYMSPIEHLWDHLDRQIRRRQNPSVTTQEMTQALVEEWRYIPADIIRHLTTSVTRRVSRPEVNILAVKDVASHIILLFVFH